MVVTLQKETFLCFKILKAALCLFFRTFWIRSITSVAGRYESEIHLVRKSQKCCESCTRVMFCNEIKWPVLLYRERLACQTVVLLPFGGSNAQSCLVQLQGVDYFQKMIKNRFLHVLQSLFSPL